MPTALVTGASRGLGLAFVRSFAGDGWQVHACCRSPEKSNELRGLGGPVSIHRLDVTDGLRVASLAREMNDEAIDILVNNAGISDDRRGFNETDFDDFVEVLKVNTLAPLRIAERFADHVARSERKLIVNISSIMGSIQDNASGGRYLYRASKAALNMITRSLSVDLRERGIVVVSFHPGWVRTDMGGEDAPISPEESVEGMREVMDRLTSEDSGRFLDYQGKELPW
jgi:NAD(P)-dependent dehydrogenase (short-subunit alcohol dehydrogenase family)